MLLLSYLLNRPSSPPRRRPYPPPSHSLTPLSFSPILQPLKSTISLSVFQTLKPQIPPIKSLKTSESTQNLLSGSTRTITTLFAVAVTASKFFAHGIFNLAVQLKEPLLYSSGPAFFAAIKDVPTGTLNTPFTVVAAGMVKWLDLYKWLKCLRLLNETNQMAKMLKIAKGNDVPDFPGNFSPEGLDFLAKCLNRDYRKRWTSEKLLEHPFLTGKKASNVDFNAVSPTSVLDIASYDCDCDCDEFVSRIQKVCFQGKNLMHENALEVLLYRKCIVTKKKCFPFQGKNLMHENALYRKIRE